MASLDGLATSCGRPLRIFVSAEQLGVRDDAELLAGVGSGFTRNPMSVAAITIWLGWTVFYGSVTVLAGLAGIWTEFAMVPFEERRLDQRLESLYREYSGKCRAGSAGLLAEPELVRHKSK